MSDRSPDSLSPAEELFADWLTRREGNGVAQDLESLCREHPKEAAELRRLWVYWEGLRSVLEKAGFSSGPRSLAEKIQDKFGSGVDPNVSLDKGEGAQPPSDALLRRLAEHTIKTSRYRFQGEIARGGMGAILKVFDEDLRRNLAMKVIVGGAPTFDKRLLARFLEEAQVTGQLDHPGIVPVHELGLDSEGRVYFTMRLVKGRDLKQIFDLVFEGKEGWSETRALGVLLKVCEALAYAHKKGVIHRDLKPANVMVGGFGEVYVMDWGLARVDGREDRHDVRLRVEGTPFSSLKTGRREERFEEPDSPLLTMDGDIVGTPAYMAPEQARGEVNKLGPQSDVYAIGAMLYHLLARQMPFVPIGARMTNRMVLIRALEGRPSALSSLRTDAPAELVAICEKAMAFDPAARYRDTLELGEDLRAFLENRVVSAYETGALAELRKWVGRNRGLAASIGAAVLLLVGGLVTSMALKAEADRNRNLAESNAKASSENEKRAQLGEAQARENEAAAKKERERAESKADEVLRLAALQKIDDLVAEADRLWPAHSDNIQRYEEWLEEAQQLLIELPKSEAKLMEIRARARPPASVTAQDPELLPDAIKSLRERLVSLREREASAIEPERGRVAGEIARTQAAVAALATRRTEEVEGLVWESREDRWWYNQLTELVAGLKTLSDPSSGLISGISDAHGLGVEIRLEFARFAPSEYARTFSSSPAWTSWALMTESTAAHDDAGTAVAARAAMEGAEALLENWSRLGLVESLDLGLTAGGRKLFAVQFGLPGPLPLVERATIFLVGGLDGVSTSGSRAVISIVSGLLADPQSLPRDTAFVAVPWGNPDGLARWSLTSTGGGRNDRPFDDDGDGRADEDGPDDVDHDGMVLEMLIEDPSGVWELASDSRMLEIARSSSATRYMRLREGGDDDGDSRFNEDGPGGVVVDHNFPDEHDDSRGPESGPNPLSEPETGALAQLIALRRTAVVLVFQGNHGMMAAPGGHAPGSGVLLKEEDSPTYERVLSVFNAHRSRIQPRLLSVYEARGEPWPGSLVDWSYSALGALAMEISVWGPKFRSSAPSQDPNPEFAAQADLVTRERQTVEKSWISWVDEERGGISLVDWQPRTLGNMSALVGGWEPESVFNPPPETLPRVLSGLASFVLDVARNLPRLEVDLREAKREGKVCLLRARVKNLGTLDTGLGMVGGGEVRLRLELSPEAQLRAGSASITLGRLPGRGASDEYAWLLVAPPDSTVRLVVESGWSTQAVRELKL